MYLRIPSVDGRDFSIPYPNQEENQANRFFLNSIARNEESIYNFLRLKQEIYDLFGLFCEFSRLGSRIEGIMGDGIVLLRKLRFHP